MTIESDIDGNNLGGAHILDGVYKFRCSKCGKYLFTEVETDGITKRIDDRENYRYYGIEDVFVCDDCDEDFSVEC